MARTGYLSPSVIASTTPQMARVLLDSLFRLTVEDMHKAITQNSEYREAATVQWATTLARRAREFYPELKL